MNAAQIREAVRLLDDAGVESRDIISFLEMGEPGCLLRLGDPTQGHRGWKEWVVKKDGSSRVTYP